MMEDEKRVTAFLEMARQHMQRFHELEEIEWKINFSVWALIGGFAYLWVTGHMTTPVWLKGLRAFLIVSIPVMLVHGLALLMLNRQHQTEAKFRNDYRDRAAELLGKPILEKRPHYIGGIRWRDWRWIGWSLLVTFGMTASVVFLMQTAIPVVAVSR